MCSAYIITWRSKKRIGEICKIQLELFEFYTYLEVVVGTRSASNLFQAILKVRAFKPLRFLILLYQFILALNLVPNFFTNNGTLHFEAHCSI